MEALFIAYGHTIYIYVHILSYNTIFFLLLCYDRCLPLRGLMVTIFLCKAEYIPMWVFSDEYITYDGIFSAPKLCVKNGAFFTVPIISRTSRQPRRLAEWRKKKLTVQNLRKSCAIEVSELRIFFGEIFLMDSLPTLLFDFLHATRTVDLIRTNNFTKIL